MRARRCLTLVTVGILVAGCTIDPAELPGSRLPPEVPAGGAADGWYGSEAISLGETIGGSVAGDDFAFYAIRLEGGLRVRVSVERTSGDLDPLGYFFLGGETLAEPDSAHHEEGRLTLDFSVEESGLHTIAIGDSTGAGGGGFELSTSCLGGTCELEDPLEPTSSGPMTFEFDFTVGTSLHGFEVVYRDIPLATYDEYLRRLEGGLDLGPVPPIEDFDAPEVVEANRSHWLMNNGLYPLPDGLPGSGLLVQGNNHSDDMDMYIVRELSAADGIEPNTTYEVRFTRYGYAANAALLASGVGGGPDLSIEGTVTVTDPLEYVLDDVVGNPHIRHPEGVLTAAPVGLGSTGVCLSPGSGMFLPGTPRCPAGRAPFVLQESALSTRPASQTVTTNADGRLWVMVGGHSGFEGYSAYFHRYLSIEVERVE